MRENRSSGFPTRCDTNWPVVMEAGLKLEILDLGGGGIVLSV